MIHDLILKNRSIRRFKQQSTIKRETLEQLVELARLSPSGSNLQPLRFYLSNQGEINNRIFETLAWAGYLKDWPGPAEGERPAAYIAILTDENSPKPPEYDVGIAAQSILLGAVEKGLGGCVIGSVKREKLKEIIDLPGNLKIALVIALGEPAEQVVVDDIPAGESIRYYRDEKDVHHVPKIKTSDL
ncbi:MAG: nitroreductase family protein, partial [Bacteroidales bacterium]|nr:nitroreductase family protein [Bacteroidales bacterium]